MTKYREILRLKSLGFSERNKALSVSSKRIPDYTYICREFLRKGVSKKLLWTEYMEDCRQTGAEIKVKLKKFNHHILPPSTPFHT